MGFSLKSEKLERRSLRALVVLLTSAAWAMAAAQTDVATIIRKSVEANERDWAANPQFDYYEQDRTGQGSKTFQVTMLYGSPYERLVEVNGEKLKPGQQFEQQRKFGQAVAQRKAESAKQRRARIAKYQADRHRDHLILTQLTQGFNFSLQGEQELDGRKVYVLKATPRAGYRPPNRDCQVLPGMEGTLWIDQATFQWVKVEAHVMRPVEIEGFVAKVEPGTKFSLEKMPVEGDIWLPKRYTMTADARVLFLLPHHSQEDDSYFNYQKRGSPADSAPPAADGNRPVPGK